ncbi:MAG: mandelate racemase/muconate lactonizing enzyme family protein, partial [Planctomycetota bacterium]
MLQPCSASEQHPYADRYRPVSTDQLTEIAKQSVLIGTLGDSPARLRAVELLRRDGEFFVKVTDEDDQVGIAVGNPNKLKDSHLILSQRVAPFFVNKDAREIERLLTQLYRHTSNYKYQGLAFWCGVAAVEMAILDLLGKRTGKCIGDLFGGVRRDHIAVYRASSHRGNSAEQEVEYLESLLEETGGTAVKFRLGGRMSDNEESPRGRSEKLIRMTRRILGDEADLYADANSSYDVENALRIGRLMQDNGYRFFEEPCPFDHLWETKEVADQLSIPVAGGEQEFSMRRFIWTIANHGVDVVQPDLHYFGGMIRSMKVARMADAANLPCTPHMSGGGLGFLYVAHFASCVSDPGPHQEYKGGSKIPLTCSTS